MGHKEENESSKQGVQKNQDLLAIIVVRQVILQTNGGEMEKVNSMENVTTLISMIIKLMNAKRN